MNFCVVTAFTFTYESLEPFFSPKPWRCTLTKVESRLNSSKTTSFVSSANIFSKLPFCCRRQKYLKTLFQLPNLGGKARHGLPVLSIHLMPLSVRRKSRQGLPIFFFGNNFSSFAHSSSVNSYGILFHPTTILSSFVHSP